MTKLTDIVRQTIQSRGLITPEHPVLIGLSGGADSVCLLLVLKELGCDVVACHCNFHLRGDESDRDMHFVEDLCHQRQVPLHVVHFDVERYCAEHGVSTEMACRDLRYAEFRRLALECGCQSVAVAHHGEDCVETMLINMLRGTGIAGAASMDYDNGNGVVRPMLDVTRKQIEEYLAEKGQAFVTDSTNAQNHFTRNQLRNLVLPYIEQLFPGAMHRLQTTAANLRENRLFYNMALDAVRNKYMDGESLKVAEVLRCEPHARLLLHEFLHPLGLSAEQIADVARNPESPGQLYYATDATGRRMEFNLTRGVLHFRESREDDALDGVVEIADILAPFEYLDVVVEPTIISKADFSPQRDPSTVYFSSDSLPKDAKWQVRPWRKADRIQPFGMKGASRLVSDIMREAGYSEFQKRNQLMLLCNNKIVWAMGLKPSAHFSVLKTDEKILCLKLKKKR